MAGSQDRTAQLEQIARLLGRTAQSFATDDEGMAILGELLEVWPRLTDDDRHDVLVFAKSLAALRARSERLSD